MKKPKGKIRKIGSLKRRKLKQVKAVTENSEGKRETAAAGGIEVRMVEARPRARHTDIHVYTLEGRVGVVRVAKVGECERDR